MAAQRVAVMDDDEPFRALMRDILTDEGYRVLDGDAARALDLIRAERPDLVTLDLVFHTGPSGLEILRALRADPALAALPVLVCSAAPDLLSAFAAELQTLGAATIAKPFAIDDLLAIVATLIGRPRGEQDTHTSSGGAA